MPETSPLIGNASFADFLLFLFVIILTFIIGAALNTLIIKFLKNKTKPVVYKSLSKFAMYGVYAFGLYFAFAKIISLNIPAGLAALGILGIAVLLPALPILQNIAAGVVLAFERPFSEEDVIEFGGSMCKVKDIMLRKTRLRALDGRIITVPNISFITGTPIVNYSKGEFIKVEVPVNIARSSDINKAVKAIKDICYKHSNILPNVPQRNITRITKLLEIPKNFFKTPKSIKELEPVVTVKNVGKDKVELEVWFWIWNILMRRRTISAFYESLIKEFDKSRIKFG